MKFSCSQKEILRALSIAQKAIGTHGTLPILENVLLSAEGQALEISATNLEISITTSLDVTIKNEGRITLPAKTIVSWIGLTDSEMIEVTKTEGEGVTLKTKDSKTTLKGISADDFPAIPMVDRTETAKVAKKDLKGALEQVVFAAAAGGTRPVLSGVLFRSEENQLVMVGTDSYRLSERKIPFLLTPKDEVSCIIPARALIELERILGGDGEDEVEIVFSKNQVLFVFNGVRLISRLIEGQFPNYQQILPKAFKNTIEIDRQSLIRTVKRVGIFARDNNNNIRLSFTPGEILITTDATEIGSEEARLPIVNSDGENQVALSGQFFLDALLVLSGEKVVLKIGEKLSPIAVTSPEEPDLLHIIMPLKI